MRTRDSLWALLLCLCGAIGMSAAAAPKYDLNGKWNSSRGPITMQHSGNDLNGKCMLSNGQMAQFQGKMDGEKISFTWSIADKQVGSGTLSPVDQGAKWAGPYTDTAKGTNTTFTLTRPPEPKAGSPKGGTGKGGVVIDITGRWMPEQREHGHFEFQQTGNSVTGTWNAMKIIPVDINGTMKQYQFEFTLEMNDTEAGKGSLTLSNDQQYLDGIIELQGRPPLKVSLKRERQR